MEVALVSVATGVLKPVLGKLATLLGDEYKRFKDVRKDIELLTYELAAMDAFLLKMSEVEDPDVQDKVWMNAVRELSYDMEDSIDDFIQSVDDKDPKPDGFIEKIKHSLRKLGKMKTHHRIASEIQELKKQIIAVGNTNARYKDCQAFSSKKSETLDPRSFARFEHASKLVGIDEPKAEIIKLLTEEDEHQLKIVSIAGFGGMGKTTLASQVYQDLKGKFECQAFVSLSKNPDKMRILRTILSDISGKSYADTEAGSIDQLISNIIDFLSDKRYFIVIDDIWDIQDWEAIQFALANNHYGSRVITTTRDHGVAQKVGGAYELKPLPSDISKMLFYGKIFGINNECPDDLVEVSEILLKKCGGVPLAIITIAGLLAEKGGGTREWNKICDSIGSGLDNSPTVKKMRKILALSYHHLPIHLKTCLLYLSIFPEDYIIERDRLIWRWICEGFLHGVQDGDLFELGESYLTELINRGLIQEVDTTACRVHDLVLDLISYISTEENFCVVLYDKKATSVATTSKVRRLFLQLQDAEMPRGRMILSHVRSLTVSGHCVKKMMPLSFFPRLRVLDLEGCDLREKCHTLEHLGSLCHLRYLALGHTWLSELFTEVENPQSLAVHIGQLKNLICLKVSLYFKITFPPGVIRKLESRQEFSSISLSKSPHIAKELRHLTNLRVLGISLEDMPDESLKHGLMESLGHLESLQSLYVSATYNFGSDVSLDFIGDGWTPPPRNLRRIFSPFGTFSYLPSWISPSNLRELSFIHIGLGHLRQEDLDILGSFPVLQVLNLSYYKNIWDEERKQWPVVRADTFQYLRECQLWILPTGGNMFAPGAMPKVHTLDFRCYIDDVFSLGLANLPSIHDSLGLDNLPSLQELHVCLKEFTGRSVSREEYHKAEAAFRCAADNHPNHPTLKLGSTFFPVRVGQTSNEL